MLDIQRVGQVVGATNHNIRGEWGRGGNDRMWAMRSLVTWMMGQHGLVKKSMEIREGQDCGDSRCTTTD